MVIHGGKSFKDMLNIGEVFEALIVAEAIVKYPNTGDRSFFYKTLGQQTIQFHPERDSKELCEQLLEEAKASIILDFTEELNSKSHIALMGDTTLNKIVATEYIKEVQLACTFNTET
jgi:hypothetical protein